MNARLSIAWCLTAIAAAAMAALAFASCGEASARRSDTEPTAVVSAPIPLGADFQRGVNHAHVHARGHGYGSDVSAAELDSLRAIGVNAIAITPFGFQRGAASDQLVGFGDDTNAQRRRGDRSMTGDDITAEIAHAHARGMTAVLKPHIWSHDFGSDGEWAGTVDQPTPDAHRRWWASYRAFALYYAGVAESSHADMYCIGTELVRMTARYPDEWRALIGEIRATYHGKLSYAAHWDREFDAIPFWDALDYIGITAYFPLDVPDSATVDQLVAAWKPHRERIARCAGRFGKPVLFLEAGYRPSTTAYREPWSYSGGEMSLGAQARAYEAMFRAFAHEPWWRGLYLWKTFTDPAMAMMHGEEMDFCFEGRPACAVVRAWYGR